METLQTNNPSKRAWPLFLLAVLLFVLGPPLYMLQVRMNDLRMPWYIPILATAGVLVAVLAVCRRPRVLSIVGLVVLAGVCGLEWFMMLVATKTPVYNGPATAGQKLPTFTTTRADGGPFADSDLASGQETVLLFFRGRW